MKKLLVGSFAFVLTLMLSTIAFAANYNITEYCGENGLINRVSGQETHFNKGDVLNVSTPTIVQSGTVVAGPEYPNLILSDGITINGNGATFDGDSYNGFIMVSSRGATVESTINNATLTNYGNNQYDEPIIGITASTGTANSYAKLTLNDVSISTGNYYPGGNSKIYVGANPKEVNTELNIVSKNKDVKMSSKSIVSYGKLNFKGKNIEVGDIVTFGKTTNESKSLTAGYVSVSSVTGVFNNKGKMTVEDIDVGFNDSSYSPTGNQPNAVFNNAGTLNSSGCIWVGSSSTFNNTGTVVSTGTISLWEDGAKFNNKGKVTAYDVAVGDEGATGTEFNNDGTMTIDGEFLVEADNKFNNNGVIKSTGASISGDFNNNKQWTASGIISVEGSSGTVNNKGTLNANGGFEGDGTINNNKEINLGGDSSGFDGTLYVENGIVNLLKGATYFGSSSSNTYNNGTLNAANGSIDNIDLSNLSVAGTMKLNIDVDLAEVAIDTITFSSIEAEENAKISLNKINLLSDANSKYTVYEFGTNAEEYINVGQKEVLGPIFTYKVSYGEEDKSGSEEGADNGTAGTNGAFINFAVSTGTTGTAVSSGTTNLLQFERLGGGDGEVDLTSGEKIKGPLNPVLLQSKVAIAASSISQEEVFDTVLNNAGNYTFFQKQGTNAGDVEDRAAPTLWVKAFGSQEDVDMEDYTKVKTTYYGAVVGLDWDRQYSDNFDATYGLFASYIGGEFKDEDWESEGDFKVKQNGGYVGLRGNWYIGKLFINGIVDYGMLQNDADNPYKSNDFNSSVIGLAARVGYNFEVARRRFTIQPSVGATGKYILTDDFETALKNGIEIKEKMDDVTNITIEPGLKLALNLGKCWILTGEGKYVVENFSGDTKVTGEGLDFILPDTSYKNYANCGLGIEKIWGYTVLHLKGNKTFGGRDGYIVNAGIEFKF